MSDDILLGSTSVTRDVFIQDTSVTTGAGLSGLVFNTANLKCYARKGATGSAAAVTLVTQTVGGAFTGGGFVQIDATNMKGVYRLDLPDSLFDTLGELKIYLFGATNMAPTVLKLKVVAVDMAAIAAYVDTEVAAILAAVDTEIAAIKAKTDNLPSDPADASDIAALLNQIIAYIDTEVAAIKAKTDALPSDPADASDIASLLNQIIAYIDTEVAAIKAKTDQLTFTTANVVDASTAITAGVANKIADHVLRRALANAAASADGDTVTFRSLLGALRKLVNKVAPATPGSTTINIYAEDDTAVAGVQVVTRDAAADPIVSVDTT